MAKHISGPWVAWSEEGTTKGGIFLHSVCRDSANEHTCVAECYGETEEMAHANARLISAAPDMLDVLIDSIEILDVAIKSREDLIGEQDEVMRDLRDRVRAAIAKAEPTP